MKSHLSESDERRIREFIATPAYERQPEMLLPSEEGEEGDES